MGNYVVPVLCCLIRKNCAAHVQAVIYIMYVKLQFSDMTH